MGDRVVIKCWDHLEFAIPQEAQCVVGTNSIHPLRAMHIGTGAPLPWGLCWGGSSFEDPHHFDTDPDADLDSTYHPAADPDSDF